MEADTVIRLAGVGVAICSYLLYFRWVWRANFNRDLTRRDLEDFLCMFTGER